MISKGKLLIIAAVWLFLLAGTLVAAPKADLWPRWQAHDPESDRVVAHSAWDRFLDKYLARNHPSEINRLNYGDVTQEDRQRLESYLDSLQETPVSQLNRQEQKAYWINLSSGLFCRGPGTTLGYITRQSVPARAVRTCRTEPIPLRTSKHFLKKERGSTSTILEAQPLREENLFSPASTIGFKRISTDPKKGCCATFAATPHRSWPESWRVFRVGSITTTIGV